MDHAVRLQDHRRPGALVVFAGRDKMPTTVAVAALLGVGAPQAGSSIVDSS